MVNLFTNIDDFKKFYPPINRNTKEATIEPYIDDAAESYIIPFISRAYYDEIVAEVQAGSISTANQAIINQLKKASANYGMYEALPFLTLDVGASGAAENSNQETTQLRQWVQRDVKKNMIKKADTHLDAVLEIMEKNASAYPTWTNSQSYTTFNKYLINKAKEYSAIININDSRRTFIKLVQWIALAEDKYIKTAIGKTLLSDLKNGGSNTYKDEVLRLSKASIAYYALYLGANHLKIRISSDGITVSSTSDGMESEISADHKLFKEWRQDLLSQAQSYIGELKSYLEDNANNIPEYSSDSASVNSSPVTSIPSNNSKSSFFT